MLADLLVLLLSLDDPVRAASIRSLIVLLGHKYPKVRTYVAELLYLQFLSDPACVGPTPEEVAAYVNTQTLSSNPLSPNNPLIGASGSDCGSTTDYTGEGGGGVVEELSEPQARLHRCGFVRSAEQQEQASALLVSTGWDSSVAGARAARQALCDIMGITLKSRAAPGGGATGRWMFSL